MMLTTALGMMIHKTKCLIFVNTPDAIAASAVVYQTYSPWIYAELTIAGITEEVEPARYKERTEKYAASGMIKEAREWPGILHTIRNLDRLRPITPKTLITWGNVCKTQGPEALDELYAIAAHSW